MTDAELRGRLLSHFYGLRRSNEGIVPVTEEILSGGEPVSREAIAGLCREMADVGLIDWGPHQPPGHVIGSARIRGPGVDAVEQGSSPSIQIRFPNKTAAVASGQPAPQAAPASDDGISDAALTEIREVVSTIKAELQTLTLSNSAKADITADINQIEVETERPTPRRRFMQLYLESLRDNLAKTAGAATAGGVVALVALVGSLLAKHFGIF